jgi:opacity protein-like surface antigen
MHVRSLLAVVLAALLAAPAAASAQARGTQKPPPARQPQSLSIGGWIGYEMGDFDGVQLRVDGELPIQQLTPQVGLSFVGSIGYTRAGEDAFGLDVTVNRLKLVPTARFTLPVNPQLSVFGDAGLGIHYTSIDFDFDFGGIDFDDSEISLMLRLGAGGFFQVNPRTRIGASIVLDPMFGDFDDTTFTVLAGLMYQL